MRVTDFIFARTLLAFGLSLGLAGCGFSFAPPPKGAVVGRAGAYDYSPSIIQSGSVQQFWWCGGFYNPNDMNQYSDTILYESIDLSTNKRYGPLAVLGESPHGWDSENACNPQVVRGTFDNPLGDGQTFTYAMYYVGTASKYAVDNSIGVAFSNDGITWKKYPQPVILSTSLTTYGVAQPVPYNADHKSGIVLFYEDNSPLDDHVETISTDGIHFNIQGTVTTEGLDPNNPYPSWGDMAYDSQAGYWYATFNLPSRSLATTADITEAGQYGFQLYRIPAGSLLTGSTPWERLTEVDTNLTGYESNFIPGLLRDMYGNVNIGPYPTIQIYPAMSNPQPAWNASTRQAAGSAWISSWDIGQVAWTPNSPLPVLNRYSNNTVHEVTTGWIDPKGGFHLESTLGHLFPVPQPGAGVAFYSCKNGSTDYFVSLDSSCEGQRILGVNGYGYSQPVAGMNLVPLYRCYTGHDHFVSTDPKCEGQITQLMLGYAMP